jgi:hypothetical protein
VRTTFDPLIETPEGVIVAPPAETVKLDGIAVTDVRASSKTAVTVSPFVEVEPETNTGLV